MNILRKLTIKNLKLNRKRSIVTIVGIMLSVALLVAVSSMYIIGMTSIVRYRAKDKGDYHVAFYNLSKEDFNALKHNRAVDKIDITQYIGCAKTGSEDPYSTYAYIQGCTKSTLEKFVKLSKGRLPQNDNEILVSNHVDKIGQTDVKLGEQITLDVGQKVDKDGKIIDKNNSAHISKQNDEYYNNLDEKLQSEKIINATTKTYTIVGITKNAFDLHLGDESQQVVGKEYLTYIDENTTTYENVSAIVKFKSDEIKNWDKITGAIINLDSKLVNKTYGFTATSQETTQTEQNKVNNIKYNIDVNSDMITLESSGLELLLGDSTYKILVIVIGIIVVASVFCIKNSFDISISEKIKQYSMLKSVGATNKQVRKNVFFEARILGLIGIPLGILVGLLPLGILIKICNAYFMDSLSEGFRLKFEFSGMSILLSIALGIVTIFLSAFSSARKASKLTIIEGIRNSSNIKIKAKKLKTPTFITKIFGIGGELSYKNLKRNKKKYRTTMLSIIISVIIIITLSSFTTIMYADLREEIQKKDYNISVGTRSYSEELYNKFVNISKSDSVKNYTLFMGTYLTPNSGMMNNDEFNNLNVYAINDEQYKKYTSELGLDYNDVKNKAIFINTIVSYDYNESTRKTYKKIKKINLKNNNNVTGKISNEPINPEAKESSKDAKDISLDIACTTNKKPFGMTSFEDEYRPLIIVSEEFYKNNINYITNDLRIRIDSSNPNKLEKDINELLKTEQFDLYNFKAYIDRQENFLTLISIFLYAFIVIIVLIGLTSIFNTITTSIELRKPEFAMLKSVGMTKKEFNRMIRLETLFMGTKSLLLGLPLGIGLSYLINYYLTSARAESTPHQLPVTAILIVTIAVFILISIIMKYSISKTNKQNIIDTIRNENI